jgi:hypothetical protein
MAILEILPRKLALRSWTRFSLRTLFVVVTLFACWLGYELNWIRQRHEFISGEAAIRERRPTQQKWGATLANSGRNAPHAPALLWLFGERGYTSVCVLSEVTDDTTGLTDADWIRIREARQLFPEAAIGSVHRWASNEEHGVSSFMVLERGQN